MLVFYNKNKMDARAIILAVTMDRQSIHKYLHPDIRGLFILVLSLMSVFTLILSGCGTRLAGTESTNLSISHTTTPRATAAPIESSTPTVILNTPSGIIHPVYGTFAGPKIIPATEIPLVMAAFDLPDEVVVWMLLGMDSEVPFSGLTPAIHLLLINPRLAKASMLSIPGSLYVYIPGYTMQRISTAYALGGMTLLRQTLAYNFGLSVDRFVIAHPGDFQWLVDDADGVEVSVLYPMPKACGGLAAGPQVMDGSKALCYATYQSGNDEVDRIRRQQQLLRLIFLKFTSGGKLSMLPVLYTSYKDWVITDIALSELMGYIPLALKLSDSERIKYFIIGWQAVTLWQPPGNSQVQVFLPNRQAISDIIESAVAVVMVPSPLSELVTTLEYELTEVAVLTEVSPTLAVPSGSETPILVTPTPTATPDNEPTVSIYP